MKLKSIFTASILLASAGQLSFADTDPVAATVNGQDIKDSMLQFYALERTQADSKNAATPDKFLADLIDMAVLAEEAKAQKLDQQQNFTTRLDFIKLSLLSQIAMIDFLEKNPISEETLQKEYDSRTEQMSFDEYKASHILLAEEEKATEVLTKLSKGSTFEELAKEYSTGPTGPKGGDLGWFSLNRMVPEFSKALAALEDGAYTEQAVQTQFGWHVIKQTGMRKGTPPSFDEVKSAISASIEQNLVKNHIDTLRSKAQIKISK